ncbi:MAG: serine hydrolase domain-containing protein [Draconibacterium sp.]|nr:serine hydrolase domain-containing protein [Draconibacterium sp.]
MKKTGLIVLIGIVTLIFFVSWQQYVLSTPLTGNLRDSLASEAITAFIPPHLEIEKIIHEYDSLITAEIKASGTVGAAVVVVYRNEVVYTKCFGVKKSGTKDLINENTIFRLASVSKPISGVLAGMLADEQVICLDDKVAEYIPGLRLKNQKVTDELTIRNLLTHTTGLTAHAYDDLVEQKVPVSQIMNKLYLANTPAMPGQVYAYQNVMFSLLDTIVACKTGKSYCEVLKEKVFIPFGMNDASTGFESFRDNENKALPHTGTTLIKLNDRYYNTTAAAGVNASISDMKNFLIALLDNENSAVNENVEELIFTPYVQTALSPGYFSQWEKVDSKAYGIGWRIVDYKGRKIAYHGGFVRGYRAEIAMCKNEQVGIVYLSNSPGTISARSVPEFINRLFAFKDNQKITQNPEQENNTFN